MLGSVVFVVIPLANTLCGQVQWSRGRSYPSAQTQRKKCEHSHVTMQHGSRMKTEMASLPQEQFGFPYTPVRPLKLAGQERGSEPSHSVLLNTSTGTAGVIASALKWLEKEAAGCPSDAFQNCKEANKLISGNVSNK